MEIGGYYNRKVGKIENTTLPVKGVRCLSTAGKVY